VVSVAAFGGAPHVLALRRADAHSSQCTQNLAGEPRDSLRFHDVPVLAAPCPLPEAQALPEYGALLRSGQMAGALCAVLERSIEYARTRVQFGRPISQFQAVQQQLAVMGEEAASADCAARSAFRAAMKDDASFEIGCAKLRANIAVSTVAAGAHQVHAAIGFTREYPLRLSTQRLWSWRSEFGNDRYWAGRIGAAVITGGTARYWLDLTARDDATARTAQQ
jgi:acyl-CoA dehydrogenase